MNWNYYDCWVCGVPFALTVGYASAIKQQNKIFFCPNGCRLGFGPSRLDEYKKESEEKHRLLQIDLNNANHARLVAEKKANKAERDKRTLERRIAHGVCPCCNKTFANLSQHMITEHKDFRLPSGKEVKRIVGPVQ